MPRLASDADRVAQILSNLVSNALKYTKHGGITLRIGTRQDEAAINWAVVDVCDTGPGIPKEDQERVFGEFQRLADSAGTDGAGIGLAISQSVARAIGGQITLASTPGEGSVFTLWLPV